MPATVPSTTISDGAQVQSDEVVVFPSTLDPRHPTLAAGDYDYLGRRVQKTVRTRTAGGGMITNSDTAFAYWDWHLLAEIDLGDSSPWISRHYAWGLDKEGVRPGAGGVGGLLMVVDRMYNRTYLALNDYIGNVVGLLDPDNGNMVAEYEYDPFGRTIRATGTYADKNSIRFSSQYTDNETGLVYFGFRYYHPQWGRFINRDPIEEEGGENLYRFVSNDPVNEWDHMGLFAWGLAAKVIKVAIKGGDIGMTLQGIVQDAKTMIDPNATAGQRAMAAASLASEIISPVSMRDAKAGVNLVQGLRSGEKAADAGKRKMADVVEKGRKGEAKQIKKIEAEGETITGRQVTFETSKGTRTRIDATTTDGTGNFAREAKNGSTARLSQGQKDLKGDVEAGTPVEGRGKNAEAAGLAGKHKLDGFKEDRF